MFFLHFPGCLDSGYEIMTVLSHPLPVLEVLEFRIPVDDFLDCRLTHNNSLSFQFFLNFVFALFKVFFPDVIDLLNDPWWGGHGTKAMRTSGVLVILKSHEMLRIIPMIPAIEDALGDPKVTTGSLGILSMMDIPIHPPQSLLTIRRKTGCFDLLSWENSVGSHIRAIVSAGHSISNRSSSIAT